MPLPSIFGSDKGMYPDKFPKPPTSREMLEDIEAMSSDDPIVLFAAALLRKGTGNDSLSTMSFDDINATGLDQLEDEPPNATSNVHDWIMDSLAVTIARNIKRTHHSPRSPTSSVSKDQLHNISAIDDPSHTHSRLKAFSSICSKGEELIGNVEVRLRDMELHCQSVIKDEAPQIN